MSQAFMEYLELFQYFGRGGMPRLSREQFEALDAEYRGLLAGAGEQPEEAAPSDPAAVARARALRLRELKALLFRDRP